MFPTIRAQDPPPWSTSNKALPHEERFSHGFNRLSFLPNRNSQRGQSDRPAGKATSQCIKNSTIEPVQPQLVDAIHSQSSAVSFHIDKAVTPHSSPLSDPSQEPIRNAGRPARASRYLFCAINT